MRHKDIFQRIACTRTGDRKVRCGACGRVYFVTSTIRKDRDYQYRAIPDQEFDEFYCGCQDHPTFDDDIPF